MSFCITNFNAVNNPAVSDECFATATRNLIVNKGTTFKLSFVLTLDGNLADLTGYSARASIKQSYSDTSDLVYLSSSNGMIKINLTSSSIDLYIPEKITRRINIPIGVYDIEIINSNSETFRVVQGTMTFSEQVST
jgi:hypothetical protein